MKKQLLLIVTMIMAVCAQAQVWQKATREVAPFTKSAVLKSNRAPITPTDNQIWWGYFGESDFSQTDGVGVGQANLTFMAGIYVPANHEIIGSSTIKAVRIYVSENVAKTMSNVSVWISKTLPANLAAADYSQSVAKLSDGANDIELTTPYEVNNEGFYIGYIVKSSNAHPIMCCGTTDAPNAFFISIPGSMDWEDLNGYGFGKLAFELLAEGATMVDYSAIPSDVSTTYTIKGQANEIPMTITNNGSEPIKNISYTITTNGNTSAEQTVSTEELPFRSSVDVNITFPADNEAAKYEKTLTITKVNGEPNSASANSAKVNVICLSSKPEFVAVIEEFTGTWCGWCPIGMIGLKYVHETYGDKAVLIAAHANDPMATSDYDPIMNNVGNFPGSSVNRIMSVYPHPSYFEYYLPYVFNFVVPGSVEVSAEWANSDKKEISINASSTFRYADNSANYGIAFVLLEDGMTGTTSSWAQTNNLSHNSEYKEYTEWYNAATKVTGLEFDHVAVAAWGILGGVDNSVPTSFAADKALPFAYSANISANKLIQDKSKLSVVALLIDRNNGMIINAAQTTIADATGIKALETSNATETVRYTLDGRQISAPQHGLNIVKMSDGSVRKVMVK